MSNCLTDAQIERLAAGELPADSASAAKDHLRDCPSCTARCRAHQAEEESLVADLRDIGSEFLKEKSTSGQAPGMDATDLLRSPPGTPPPAVRRDRADSGGQAEHPNIEGYEIIAELHSGGQGVVYRAIQKTTNREVAIKILREGGFASASARKRFDREVSLVAQLNHPNIITIFDSGHAPGIGRYYVMDYVRGEPLNEHIKKHKLSLPDTLRLFVVVCRGMHYAHQRGVVHRDLKPSNILVDTGVGSVPGALETARTPRILDFGLAKSVDARGDSMVTLSGQVFGTLPYMAPEQVRGEPEDVDASADVYALGIVLYELLTGRFPYPVDGQMHEVFRHIAETDPVSPRSAWDSNTGISASTSARRRRSSFTCPIDNEVETIVLRCLAKEPSRRYGSAQELADDIDRYLSGRAIQAKRDSRLYVFRKSLRRNRIPVALGITLVVATLSVLGILGLRKQLRLQRGREREQLIAQCQDAVMLMDAPQIDRLLQRAPNVGLPETDMHVYRGWGNTIRLDVNRAMKDADRAIELDSKNGMAYTLRACLNVYDAHYTKAALDFARAQKHAGDTTLEIGLRGILKGLLGQYDAGLADLDVLIQERGGTGGIMWFRGFLRWFKLLRDAPIGLEARWRLAEESLEDIDAAARLYPSIAFVFDLRADLYHRMALLAQARNDREAADKYWERRALDAEHILELGAPGSAYRIQSEDAWAREDVEECLRLADLAYRSLTSTEQARSISNDDALEGALVIRLLARWVLGDDAATRSLAEDTIRAHPEIGRYMVTGFLESGTNPAGKLGIADDEDEFPAGQYKMISPSNDYGFAVWVGAMSRGDRELAELVAGRISVGIIDRVRWTGILTSYIQEKGNEESLFRAAEGNLIRLQVAHLAIAMRAESPSERTEHLEAVLDSAHPNFVRGCARAILLREQRERRRDAAVRNEASSP